MPSSHLCWKEYTSKRSCQKWLFLKSFSTNWCILSRNLGTISPFSEIFLRTGKTQFLFSTPRQVVVLKLEACREVVAHTSAGQFILCGEYLSALLSTQLTWHVVVQSDFIVLTRSEMDISSKFYDQVFDGRQVLFEGKNDLLFISQWRQICNNLLMLFYKPSLLRKLDVFNDCLKRYLETEKLLLTFLLPLKKTTNTQNQITNTRAYMCMCLWAGLCLKICAQASF